ncbi:MAG: putative DNA-binding domain-containing protein [Kistimonas sp.]|nr:putative DNA-binding domain-containing protein [Kistimonas sp.]
MTRHIRRGGGRDVSPGGGECYRRLVLDNIRDAVTAAFPCFWACLPPGEPSELASRFLASHGSLEPQFSRLASEFVRFMQPRLAGEANSLALTLLEYEWLLLSLRNTGARVPSSLRCAGSIRDDYRLKTNPTLVCVSLPFSPDTLPWTHFPQPARPTVYALFRDRQHRVISLALRNSDRQFLAALLAAVEGLSAIELRRGLSNDEERKRLHAWLDLALDCDLVQCFRDGRE